MTICIDTETTGLTPGEDELLQVSIVDGKGSLLFNEYIQPARATEWPGAQLINHITPAMVAGCPTIGELVPHLNEIFAEADTIAGYNTKFDLDFLRAAGVVVPARARIIDVMEIYALVAGDWDEDRERFRYKKLTACAAHYGYEWPSGPHDSLQDALATLFCWPRAEADLMP